MGNDMVERSPAAFYAIIGRLGVKLEGDSPIKKDFETYKFWRRPRIFRRQKKIARATRGSVTNRFGVS
jgi:hypothetical protein